MIGQGSPTGERRWPAGAARALSAGIVSTLAVLSWCVAAPSAGAEREASVRVEWGGGETRLWNGSIAIDHGRLSAITPLGIEADEVASLWIAEGQVQIRQRSARAYDGVDLVVQAEPDAKLVISLTSQSGDPPGAFEVALAELIDSPRNLPLDQTGSRLLVRRTPGDLLRVRLDRDSLVFATGEPLSVTLEPQLTKLAPGASVRLRAEVTPARGGRVLWSSEHDLHVPSADGEEGEAPDTAQGAVPESLKVPLEVSLPQTEGAYNLHLTVHERSLRQRIVPVVPTKPLVERTVQFVVLGSGAVVPRGQDAWKKMSEIDPANPGWWKRMVQLPHLDRLPGLPHGPWGSGQIQPWHHALGEMMRIPQPEGNAGPSWQAYPLAIERPGTPHLLVVEYPSDVPQHLGISVVEPNSAGAVLPIGVDSGVYVADDTAGQEAKLQTHRILFWPRTKSPLVLLTYRAGFPAAVFRKIRVLVPNDAPSPSALDAAAPLPAADERLAASYFDRPLLPECFAAPGVLDAWSGQEVDDWETFYQAGTRLVEYLQYAGCNGAMIAVLADGSSIYPSPKLQPTPRYDTGLLGTAGRDPVRKDVLELLMRLFDRQGLRLLPALEFAAPLPELEAVRRQGGPAAVGLDLVGPDGGAWLEKNLPQRGLAPYYNPLDPRVQHAMLEAAREVVARYASHRAFAGLALQLTSQGYTVLPGPEWGMDDETVRRFEMESGVHVETGPGPERFAQREAFLLGEGRESWLKWRAATMTHFYDQLAEVVRSARPEARLYLAGAGLLDCPAAQLRLHPGLPQTTTVEHVIYELGVDAGALAEGDRIVLLRPRQIAPPGPLASRALALRLDAASELDRRLAGGTARGALLFHPPERLRVETFDEQNPLDASPCYALLVSQAVPSGPLNRRRFAESIAALDPTAIFDGGWLLPLGQEDATRRMLTIFRQLPSGGFQTSLASRQPVVLRVRNAAGETHIYAVNQSPWPVKTVVQLDAPAGCTMQELGGAQHARTIGPGGAGSAWTIALEPWDLAAARFGDANVHIAGATIDVAADARAALERQIDDLSNRAASLANQPPLAVLDNPDFELPHSPARVPGWALFAPLSGMLAVDRYERHSGEMSLRLSGKRQVVSLQSNLFAIPQTGRLALVVWVRTDEVQNQPVFRLAVEGPDNGRAYYRFAQLGGNRRGDVPLTREWRQYQFQVEDLPVDTLERVRVRFDLMTPGNVWIDDVELYDLKFNKNERIELSKILVAAHGALREGQLADCRQLLEGYWPQFLRQFVAVDESAAAHPVPTPLSDPAAAPPSKRPESRGMLERLKGYLPRFMRN